MRASFTDYNSYVLTMAEMAAINDMNEPNFQAVIPAMIDSAELRIYRELNLLSCVVRSLGATTVNSRTCVLPFAQNTVKFTAVQGVNIMKGNARIALIAKSRYFLDFFNGGTEDSTPGVDPQVYAMLDDQTLLIAPPPAVPYNVEIVGTIRPAPLSATNQSTFITSNLADLMLAASMVFLAGFQKNFGAMADAPQGAASWEGHYQNLRKGANDEELRKRYNTVVNYPEYNAMASAG